MLDFLLPWIARYDAAVFHRREYVPDPTRCRPPYIWPPAIDPLAPKNMALSAEDAAYIVDQFGIDVKRPLITQVSRFDPWKDPLGVIEAWRVVRESHPDVQLALVGSMAHDDPEGWEYYNRTVARGRRRPGHLHPLEPQQRRLGRGERVPGALGRRPPEVDPRGLRPDGDRGALEGAAGRRRPGRRDRRPDPGRRDRLPRRVGRGVRRTRAARSSTTPGGAARWRSAARSTSAGTSSRRGSCATGSRSSTGCVGNATEVRPSSAESRCAAREHAAI